MERAECASLCNTLSGRGQDGPSLQHCATLCRAGDRMGRVCNLCNTLSGRGQDGPSLQHSVWPGTEWADFAPCATLFWAGDRLSMPHLQYSFGTGTETM